MLPVLGTVHLYIAFLRDLLLIEGYVQGALLKEVHIPPFVERFETISLGKSY